MRVGVPLDCMRLISMVLVIVDWRGRGSGEFQRDSETHKKQRLFSKPPSNEIPAHQHKDQREILSVRACVVSVKRTISIPLRNFKYSCTEATAHD